MAPPSLYVLVLNPHLEHQYLEFSVHLSLHFLDVATEAAKISLFICVEICYYALCLEDTPIVYPDCIWHLHWLGEYLITTISG